MNVLQIRSEFRDNGPGTQSLEIAKEMKKRGYETIFASSGGVMEKEISKFFKHITIPTLAITKRDPFSTIKNILEIRKIIINEKIDIIHGHNAAATYCAYLAGKFSGRRVKTTHSVRGMEIRPGYGWRNSIYKFYNATFFAVSDFTKQMLLSAGVKPDRIIVTYNGVDISRFDPQKYDGDKIRGELGIPDDTIVIGEVGAFGREKLEGKGQYYLIEAFEKVHKEFSNTALILVGDGPSKKDCEDLAQRLGISDAVYFLGFRRDIPDIQASIDIAALVSPDGEMFPNALLEAMAMGNPWVASSLSGIPEMAEKGLNGLLTEPRNVEDIYEKLKELVQNKELRNTMGKHCYNTVMAKYTIKVICDKIEKAYKGEKC